MAFKFEKLEVWQRAVDYVDTAYDLAEQLPAQERYNLADQLRRAATSISLNIAEGSTGQTDAEQARFLGMALRSLHETIACLHLIHRRAYVREEVLRSMYEEGDTLAAKLQAFRNALDADGSHVKEAPVDFVRGDDNRELDDRPWTTGSRQRTTDEGHTGAADA
ncbi:four helix bundle protein [Salinibacter ruber]|uniref:four helix bundle protein n=1 Tax=Salinibacter ruber TaxID=146919 RepID=UPI002073ADEA|nr:four helix bundle protein [Salinibacter ruber]